MKVNNKDIPKNIDIIKDFIIQVLYVIRRNYWQPNLKKIPYGILVM